MAPQADIRRYPIGIQTFEKLIEGRYLYIDKTKQIYDLTHGNSGYIFLSRPRRFGKSLLASTLHSYFEGRSDLFSGLAIEQLETEWTRHPVLHFDMSKAKHVCEAQLLSELGRQLSEYEQQWDIDQVHPYPNARLEHLIKSTYRKTGRKVVVIIDEYDAPLLDVIHEDTDLPKLREIMRNFYSPLKACDPYLRFVFITGITKFSQLSIFSELNNINNISMWDKYGALCGITKDELLTQLRPEIETLSAKQNLSFEATVQALTHKYDGYHFSAQSPDLFNPFSLLNCFDRMELGDYWFSSGTPTYLIEMMRRFGCEPSTITNRIEALSTDFDAPTERMTSIMPLMYQSGYLTIKDFDPSVNIFTLDIPNEEVRSGLMNALIPNYIDSPSTSTTIAQIARCFHRDDICGALDKMSTFFASVPYCNNTDYEGHWQQMLYVVMSLFGAYGDVEVHTSHGRVDLVMLLGGKLYLIETKLNGTADNALHQIDIRNYSARFALQDKPIIKIGIAFEQDTHTMRYKIAQ